MGLYFRKRGSLFGNLLRFSLTGAGLGVSLGIKGLRAGISSSRRPYVSAYLPGTGLYLRHYAHSRHHPTTHAIASRSPLAIPHPVSDLPQPHGVAFAVGTVLGYLIILAPFLLVWWLLTR
jgi:hypothetical protein